MLEFLSILFNRKEDACAPRKKEMLNRTFYLFIIYISVYFEAKN